MLTRRRELVDVCLLAIEVLGLVVVRGSAVAQLSRLDDAEELDEWVE